MPELQRYALCVEYDGTEFVGWQTQIGLRSVQAAVETALSAVADEPLTVVAAGRTDAGVHASGQVVHFDTARERPLKAWVLGVNAHLPRDIAVRWVCPVRADFHARFSATGRHYRYVVCERRSRPALFRNNVAWSRPGLDVGRMGNAAALLTGRHDFSAFRAAACQARSPVRSLRRLNVERHGAWVVFEVQADAFLHHMVRNLVGTLLRVGHGEADAGWPARVLEGRDRRLAGPTAPASGLILEAVVYPPEFSIPESGTLSGAGSRGMLGL